MAIIDPDLKPKLPIQNYDIGPFKGSNGAFYVILLTEDELGGACYKAATDPTATGAWSVQDVGRSPTGMDTIPSAAARRKSKSSVVSYGSRGGYDNFAIPT